MNLIQPKASDGLALDNIEPRLKLLRIRCIPSFWFIGIGIEFTTIVGGIMFSHTYTSCSGKIGFLFFTIHFMFPVNKWKRRN